VNEAEEHGKQKTYSPTVEGREIKSKIRVKIKTAEG
jgi:hypothetical protein